MGLSTDSNFKYSAKGDWATSCNRNHLARHVREGGMVSDPIGHEIAGQFVDGMMLSQDFAQLASLHRFNREDLILVISAATEAGLKGEIPSPCVQDGFPRLLGCVLLQNHDFLEGIMRLSNRLAGNDEFIAEINANPIQASDAVRRAAIIKITSTVGKGVYERVTAANGPPDFGVEVGGQGMANATPPGGCGCASIILLGFFLGAAGAVWTLNYV